MEQEILWLAYAGASLLTVAGLGLMWKLGNRIMGSKQEYSRLIVVEVPDDLEEQLANLQKSKTE